MEDQRKIYLTEKIKLLYSKKPTITVDQIWNIFSKAQKVKFHPKSQTEIEEILEYIIFDLELEKEIEIENPKILELNYETEYPELDKIDYSILRFLQEMDGHVLFYSVDKISEGIHKHKARVLRHAIELTEKKFLLKKKRKSEFKLNADLTQIQYTKLNAELKDQGNSGNLPENLPKNQKLEYAVVCTKCGNLQTYRGDPSTERKHTKCNACGTWFNINPIKQDKLQDLIETSDKKETILTSLQLDATDKQILELLQNKGIPIKLSQKAISQTVNKSLSTISRHLRKLSDLQIIDEIRHKIKFYQIGEQYLKIDESVNAHNPSDSDEVNMVCLHHYTSYIPILNKTSKNINLSILKTKLPEIDQTEIQPKGPKKHRTWNQYKFELNQVIFRFTPKHIIFNVIGIGKTTEEAFQNQEEKTEKIKTYFETNLPMQLGKPYFKAPDGEIHYIPTRIKQDEVDQIKEIWEDKSHPNTFETKNRQFADRMIRVDESLQMLIEDHISLKNHVETLEQPTIDLEPIKRQIEKIQAENGERFSNLEIQMSSLTKSIESLVTTLNSAFQPKTEPTHEEIVDPTKFNQYI